MRLVLDRKDFVRAQILSKKISPATFKEREKKEGQKGPVRDSTVAEPLEGTPALAELKLMYYSLMIRFHMYSDDYLEASRIPPLPSLIQ